MPRRLARLAWWLVISTASMSGPMVDTVDVTDTDQPRMDAIAGQGVGDRAVADNQQLRGICHAATMALRAAQSSLRYAAPLEISGAHLDALHRRALRGRRPCASRESLALP
jgi:hypothetical protein